MIDPIGFAVGAVISALALVVYQHLLLRKQSKMMSVMHDAVTQVAEGKAKLGLDQNGNICFTGLAGPSE